MNKRKKMWVYSPSKSPKPKVPDNVKRDTTEKAEELINTVLKPSYIKPPPKDSQFNYIIDIYTKWYRSYFYFCTRYHCPGPNAISPYFEAKFARLEYKEDDCFNLSYMRHTDQWFQVYTDLSLEQCLSVVKDDPLFHP